MIEKCFVKMSKLVMNDLTVENYKPAIWSSRPFHIHLCSRYIMESTMTIDLLYGAYIDFLVEIL